MKREIVYKILCIFFSIMILASFSKPPVKEGKTFKDEAGRTVIVPPAPRSIVSLSPSNTEILFAIGEGDNIVGVTDYCNYPLAVSGIPKVGGFSDVNIEKIVELGPDLIFASNLHISKVLPALENLGFTVIIVNPVTVLGVFDSITFIGTICEKEFETNILITDLRERYNAITRVLEKQKPITIFWELSEDLWTIGKGSFLDDLITHAGGHNIASELNAPWLQLSSEFILNANPSMIFLADHPYGLKLEKISTRPGWNSLAAVQNKRIIEVTPEKNDIVSRPGPRVIDALAYIAGYLHPELF